MTAEPGSRGGPEQRRDRGQQGQGVVEPGSRANDRDRLQQRRTAGRIEGASSDWPERGRGESAELKIRSRIGRSRARLEGARCDWPTRDLGNESD